MEWSRVSGSGSGEFFRRVKEGFDVVEVDESCDVNFLGVCGYGSCVGVGNYCGYDVLCDRLLSGCSSGQRRWLFERVVCRKETCELKIHEVLSDSSVRFSVSTSSKVRRSDFRTLCVVFLLLLPRVSDFECRTHAELLRRVYDWHDRGIYEYGRLFYGALLRVGLCV